MTYVNTLSVAILAQVMPSGADGRACEVQCHISKPEFGSRRLHRSCRRHRGVYWRPPCLVCGFAGRISRHTHFLQQAAEPTKVVVDGIEAMASAQHLPCG